MIPIIPHIPTRSSDLVLVLGFKCLPMNENKQICCPPFLPEIWDDKVFAWENKKFIRDRVLTFFYMPLNFGKAMKRVDKLLSEHGATMSDYLCLSDNTSLWNMDLYVAVDREIPGTNVTTMSGNFYCKVYEGPFRDSGNWILDFKRVLSAKGYNYTKSLMWYTTCPKCEKKYGKNYVAIFNQI